MRKLLAAAMLLLLAGGGVVVSALGQNGSTPPDNSTAVVDGPRLTASATRGDPGDQITLTGLGCLDVGADRNVRIWLTPASGVVEWQVDFGEPVAIIDPDADGTWTASITVLEFPVEYQLEAACFDEAVPPNGFIYDHLVFDARP